MESEDDISHMALFILRMRRTGASEGSHEIASAFGLAMTDV